MSRATVWRALLARIPLPMLALAASYGVYSFNRLFVPVWVALVSAAAFELTYVGLAVWDAGDAAQRHRARAISLGAVGVSVIYNTLAGLAHRAPDVFDGLPRTIEIALALLHGAPLAIVAFLVADLLLHAHDARTAHAHDARTAHAHDARTHPAQIAHNARTRIVRAQADARTERAHAHAHAQADARTQSAHDARAHPAQIARDARTERAHAQADARTQSAHDARAHPAQIARDARTERAHAQADARTHPAQIAHDARAHPAQIARDARAQALAALQAGASVAEVARHYQINPSTLRSWRARAAAHAAAHAPAAD